MHGQMSSMGRLQQACSQQKCNDQLTSSPPNSILRVVSKAPDRFS
jgi:hypothetical protein